MVWVKVCGVTTRAAAEAAVAAGADAIGLVLIESPRRISAKAALEISHGLDVERIVLIDTDTGDAALALTAAAGATGVQVYGSHASAVAEACRSAGYMVLRPARADSGFDLGHVAVDHIPLLDSGNPTMLGGTGIPFAWSGAADIERPFVVAGGLSSDNVADAIAATGAWGVDASSRLESSPGLKDPELVRAFVAAARQEQSPP